MSKTTIEIPLPLGVTLWWTSGPHREQWIECPECCGTKAIDVILGNGDRFSLDCRCCQSGFDPPLGRVKTHIFEYRPVPFIALRVSMEGNRFLYSESPPDSGCYSSVQSTHLFSTPEECQAKCDEMNAEHAKQEAQSLVYQRGRARKDLAWSAHYWGSQVRTLEKELERARSRLQVCKERKKGAAA